MKVTAFIKKYTMVIALVVVFIIFSVLTDGRLLYPQNLSNLLLQNAYVLVLSCGMLLCILTGGNVDLSIGSTVCLAGAIGAQLLSQTGIPAVIVILICIASGVLIGIWQGFWIGYVHIPPFICTLSGMFLFRGLARVVLDSKTVSIKNNTFLNIFASYIQIPGLDTVKEEGGGFFYNMLNGLRNWLLPLIGQDPEQKLFISAAIAGVLVAIALVVLTIVNRVKKSRKGYRQDSFITEFGRIIIIAVLIVLSSWKLANYKGIPVMMLWVLAVVLIYAFITSRTAFGRYFYAVGGNEKATKLSGINTQKVYFMAYASMSTLAAVSAIIPASRRRLRLKAVIAGWLRSHDTRVGVIESDSFSRRYPGGYPLLHEILGFFRHHKIELGVDIQRHARASVHPGHSHIGDLYVYVLCVPAACLFQLVSSQNVF